MKDPFAVDDWQEQPKHLLEKDIQNPSVAKARRAGWWARKFSTQGKSSVPDYIFAKGGNVFFVEFKAPGKVATPKQEEEHKKMRACGCVVYVCDSLEWFDTLMKTEELYAANLNPR